MRQTIVPHQLNLWGHPTDSLPDLDVLYEPCFLDSTESRAFFKELRHNTPWRQEVMTMHGREVAVPRLIAWYGDMRHAERYSRIPLEGNPWTAALYAIKARVEERVGIAFNTVLLSLYRDGADSVAWHRDYTGLVGSRPVIAAVSLGATRRFLMKHRERRDLPTLCYPVKDGSLLVMRGDTNEHWLHHVPKTKTPIGERISLTFRVVR